MLCIVTTATDLGKLNELLYVLTVLTGTIAFVSW